MKHQPEISLIGALAELEQSKGIPRDVIFDALESALLSACKKNYAGNLHFRVDVNREDGTIHTFIQKEVVEGDMCGLNLKLDRKLTIEIGDKLEFFKRELKRRKLD